MASSSASYIQLRRLDLHAARLFEIDIINTLGLTNQENLISRIKDPTSPISRLWNNRKFITEQQKRKYRIIVYNIKQRFFHIKDIETIPWTTMTTPHQHAHLNKIHKMFVQIADNITNKDFKEREQRNNNQEENFKFDGIDMTEYQALDTQTLDYDELWFHHFYKIRECYFNFYGW